MPAASQTAIVFDLDGVLALTEPLKAKAHALTIRELGGVISEDFYGRVMGMPHEEVLLAFSAKAQLQVDPNLQSRVFRRIYDQLLDDDLRLEPGIAAALELLHRRGMKTGLVTSSSRSVLDLVLRRTALGEFLDTTISANDVRKPKPSPDAYLVALSKLGIPHGRAIAVEDSEPGVSAARAAGMRVIAIRHSYNRNSAFSTVEAILDTPIESTTFVSVVDRLIGSCPRILED